MKNLISIMICIVLCGCSIGRDVAKDISGEEVKNNVATRKVAIDYLKIWPMQSGFLHGLMQHREDEFPEHVVEAINELDKLSQQLLAQDPNELGDYDLGMSLGLRVRMLGSIVEEVFKAYAPDVLNVVPLIF